MTWTLTNLIIQAVAGLFGGLAVAGAVKEHRLGLFGDAIVGLVAGLLSGYFLQGLIGTIVTGNGVANPTTGPETVFVQLLGGATSGACLAVVVGLVWHSIAEHRPDNKQAPR